MRAYRFNGANGTFGTSELLHTKGKHEMNTTTVSDAYIKRCYKTLKDWDAPLSGWYCIHTFDVKDQGWSTESTKEPKLFKCELCGCDKVRFIHVMHHNEFYEDINVGCICAGIMEDDILSAVERERVLRNRYNRKKNFLKQKWYLSFNGNETLLYKNKRITIVKSKFDGFGVICGEASAWRYKNRKITDFRTAADAAFDLVDPLEAGG
jgi:hypothetical protein